MKRLISIMMSGICAFGIASQVVAISISLQPSSQTIGVGGNASVAVVISDLGNFASPSLGGFDFDLTYDSSIISAISLVSGSHLDLGVLGSIQNSDLSTPGGIHLDELSFESESDLNANQPATFTLVTLGFTGLAPGSSILAFTFAALSDEAGASISDFNITGGSIRVNGVPDSGSTWPLLALGFLSLLALRWMGCTAFYRDTDEASMKILR